MNLICLLLWACSSPLAPAPAPTPWPEVQAPRPPVTPSPAIALGQQTPTELLLPPSVRPDSAPAPAQFPAPGPWKSQGAAVWSAPLPVDFHLFLQRQTGARTFGFYAPEGLEILLGGTPLRFERGAKSPGTWGYDPRRLLVNPPAGESPPEGVEVRWPKATAAEQALHLATSGLAPLDFARRRLSLGTTSHTGLLLPAPATVAWSVDVPPEAVFTARSWILPPAIHTAEASDGATVQVEVVHNGATSASAPIPLTAADTDLRVPLPAGPCVIRLTVQPGTTAVHDLVFVEDPTVYVPKASPERVVLAFVDTVRADHLGMYGYARPTSPRLDAWARGATRFDDHRTVSPWTLPSTLTALSGHQPEAWPTVATLAERFQAAGYRTEGIVANAYLSQVFGVDRGFAQYDYRILQPAALTVEQALERIHRYPDRDLFLLVQFMEAHLPYDEPQAYRTLFAGDKPEGLKQVARTDLVRYSGDEPDFPAVRDYVIGRYDQNLRVLDDEVGRLFEAVGPEATTVLFSDHGEELWDHGGFEHGHTFYDELLRVPLVIRSPALRGGAVDVPTSLLDLAPTVAELAGLPAVPAMGASLVLAAAGDEAARTALRARPQAFGRPLYGDDGWGVLAGDVKWITRGGEEQVHTLASDPTEQQDRAAQHDRTDFPTAAGEALGRPMVRVWRVALANERLRGDVVVRFHHPEGLAAVWSAYDPKGWYEDVVPELVDGDVVLRRPAGAKAPPELVIVPKGDALRPEGLVVTIEGGAGRVLTATSVGGPDDGSRRTVVVDPERAVTVDLGWGVAPGGTAVRGTHAEVEGALRELGYVE